MKEVWRWLNIFEKPSDQTSSERVVRIAVSAFALMLILFLAIGLSTVIEK